MFAYEGGCVNETSKVWWYPHIVNAFGNVTLVVVAGDKWVAGSGYIIFTVYRLGSKTLTTHCKYIYVQNYRG